MKETNIKEAISKVLDEKDCFTFFWEHFNGDINTVISEFKKNKVKYKTAIVAAFLITW